MGGWWVRPDLSLFVGGGGQAPSIRLSTPPTEKPQLQVPAAGTLVISGQHAACPLILYTSARELEFGRSFLLERVGLVEKSL